MEQSLLRGKNFFLLTIVLVYDIVKLLIKSCISDYLSTYMGDRRACPNAVVRCVTGLNYALKKSKMK